MTVHFYTFSDENAGSSRQRGFRVARELEKRGIHCTVHYPPVVYIARTRWPKKGLLILQTIRSLFSIRKDDIIYLQRATYSKYFFVIMVLYLKLFRRKMIFDFDDPIYTHSFTKTRVFTQMASAVITCTHGQAQWAKQYNADVTVVHIALDPAVYKKFTKHRGPTDEPIIGWVGAGPEHLANFEIIVPVFKELVQRGARFTFVLIGALKNEPVYDLFRSIGGLNVQFIDTLDWKDPEAVPREIGKFDIGILPHQSEGEWNRSKTSLKNLEYMAAAVPAVCSRYGEMPYVYDEGVNGFLAGSTEEWVAALAKLLADPVLREQVGQMGQRRVEEAFTFDGIVPLVASVIRRVEAHR